MKNDKDYKDYIAKIIGVILIASAFISGYVILNDRSIFSPDGDIIEYYLLSRNLLIIFILNWIFLLGLKLIKK
ncbi:hypothetical protein [Streptococcus zalophi]|uniref:Uncharacterized protein n=1 Tax=Streptococcus zalophi TaxID=640031 RepID=A0A934PA78_9STRE|nr:hypothetical protein [Streptococcus zalophi]MBJ8349930.1 hypothetical protein [Streptococcus zalophi]